MTPTNRLRFVERENFVSTDESGQMLPVGFCRCVVERVLQQWWNDTGPNGGPDVGEWRDVPLEQE
jgi:hypothetical protein